ncbi:MAG: hypothetical protein M1825_002083 [Sarcosagium campestre]|nr:MAG: hypothetical protein M1825_002083 [Sarcosagium campestre]
MCIIEVFRDVFPNNVEQCHKRLTACECGRSDRPCENIRWFEHEPRLLPWAEAPVTTTVIEVGPRSADLARSPRSTSSFKSKGLTRRYLTRGEMIMVDFNLPSFGRKKKKGSEHRGRRRDENTRIREVEIIEPFSYDDDNNDDDGEAPAAAEQGPRFPVPPPPPAPMAPSASPNLRNLPIRRRRSSRRVERDDDIVAIEEPDQSGEHRVRRRSPIIHYATPRSSTPQPSARVEIETERHTRHRRASPTRRHGTRDHVLRRQVDDERQDQRDGQRMDLRQRHESDRARAATAREEGRIRVENVAAEMQQLARDRANRLERDQDQAGQRNPPQEPRREGIEQRHEDRDHDRHRTDARSAFNQGRSVFRQNRRPISVHYDQEDIRSSGESIVSMPRSQRVVPRQQGSEGMMAFGERVLDAAADRTRWREGGLTGTRREERRRSVDAGTRVRRCSIVRNE